jgi:DNA-binding MarR family transcriptional regulator
MGDVMHATLAAHLGEELTTNAAVATIFQLDLQSPMRPGEIQQLTSLSSGGVTKLLARLEASGLITREHGVLDADRRGSVVRITPKGRRVTKRAARALLAVMSDVRTMLTEIDSILR